MIIELCTSPFGGASVQMFRNDQEVFCKSSEAVISSFAAVRPLDIQSGEVTVVTVEKDTAKDNAAECSVGTFALDPWSAPSECAELNFTEKLRKSARDTASLVGDAFRKVRDTLKNWITGAGDKLRKAWECLSDTFISITKGSAVTVSGSWESIHDWDIDHTVFTPAEVRSEIIAPETTDISKDAQDSLIENMFVCCLDSMKENYPENDLSRKAESDIFDFVQNNNVSDSLSGNCVYPNDRPSKRNDRSLREYNPEKLLRGRIASFSGGNTCLLTGTRITGAKTFAGVTDYGKSAAPAKGIQLHIDPDTSYAVHIRSRRQVTQYQDMCSAA